MSKKQEYFRWVVSYEPSYYKKARFFICTGVGSGEYPDPFTPEPDVTLATAFRWHSKEKAILSLKQVGWDPDHHPEWFNFIMIRISETVKVA